MKRIIFHFVMTVSVLTVLSSCNNHTPKEAKYIPKEASFVLVLDPEQLQDKLQKGGIGMDTLLKRVFKNDSLDSKDKERFNQLKDNAGMDWTGKLFLFATQKSNVDNSTSNIISVMGSMKDSAKFRAFLLAQDEMKGKGIKQEKEFNYLIFEEGSMLAWNDQQVIATMYTHAQKAVYDTVEMTFKKPTAGNNEAEMKTAVSHYFTQKVNESLADVAIFTDMFKEKADGYMFSSTNSSIAGLSALPLQIPKLEELLKDNYVTNTLSFEDGKIIAKGTSYTNQLLSSVLKQYAGPTVNLSMIDHFPSKYINGVMLASFNPEIFGGFLKQLEVEGLVNSFMEKSGFTSQDLYKSLKGDIAVVVSDFDLTVKDPQFKSDEHNLLKRKPFLKMILNAPIGDKAAFNKIMEKATAQGILTKQGNVYKSGGLASALGVFIIADEKALTIASDSATYIQYQTKAEKPALSSEVLDRFKGKSTVFYLDIASTINGFSKDDTESFHQSLLKAKETFKDILVTSDNFDGKNIKSQLEIRMQNEKQNSLVTITSLLTDIAVDMRVQARKEKDMEEKLFPGGIPAIIRTN